MRNSIVSSLLLLAAWTVCPAEAADLLWDGANIGGTGDGVSTYATGTWSTANANWDAGNGVARVAWNNAGLDTPIFAGTFDNTAKTVTVTTPVTVNQIKIQTGTLVGNSGNRYNFDGTGSITFGGNYSAAFPSFDITVASNNFGTKITGDLTGKGGLVIKHGSTANSASGGRMVLNGANDFTGDVTLLSGCVDTTSNFGDAANKVILNGGSLSIVTGTDNSTRTIPRNLEVAAGTTSGGIAISINGGSAVLDYTGSVTGSGTLTRNNTGAGTMDVRFSGDMSGFTGTVDNRGSTMTIQSTATSGGAWKLTGGTLRLNTADNTHIADGAGKSDLLMNAGTLDLNGKSETINGLSGATGTVQNQLAATSSTLTLGAGDATATFGGTIRNSSSGTGGTMALTKTGSGTQTLTSDATYSGPTTIEGGNLVLGAKLENSPVTVKSGASLTVSSAGRDLQALALEGGATLSAPLDVFGNYLGTTGGLTLSGGTVTLKPIFTEPPSLGPYNFVVASGGITGSATFVTDFFGGISRINGTAQVVDNVVQLTINSTAATLTWNNHDGTGIWNFNGDDNFRNGAANDVFKQYDNVTFGQSSPTGTITLNGTLLPASVMVDSSNNFTFAGSGTIAGLGFLNKAGSGILTIANANTFTGLTTVNAGTLNLGDGSVNGSVGGQVVSEATVNFNTIGTAIHAGGLAGSGVIAKKGPGTLVLTGDNTHVGNLNVDEGTLQIGNGTSNGTFGTSNYMLAPNTRLHLNYATAVGTAAIDGYLSRITGSGTVELSSAQAINGSANWGPSTADSTPWSPSFTGTLQINRGRTSATPAGLGGMGKMIVKDGAQFMAWTGTYSLPFEIAGNGWGESGQSGALRVAGGYSAIINGDITLTADAGINSQTATSSMTINGVISGAFNITKSNPGPLILGGANTYSGTTTVSGGSIRLDHQFAMQNSTLANGGVSFGATSVNYSLGGLGGAGNLALQNTSAAPVTVSIGNNNATTTHTGVISGPGHLIKTGSGTLNLDGVNTYTGNTTVAGGVLSISSAYLDDNSTVSIASGAKLDLDTAGASDTIGSLVINGAVMNPGTYNATSHPAFISGSGNLIVKGAAYDTWMDGFPSLTGADKLPDADPDHDGVKNLLEFVLNGNPTTSDPAILPTSNVSGGNMVFTFHRRDDSEGLVNQTVQYGTNLATWSNVVIGAVDGSSGGATYTVTENGSSPDLITVTIPTAGDAKKFARLLVESAP